MTDPAPTPATGVGAAAKAGDAATEIGSAEAGLAEVAAGFAERCRAAGVPVGPDRAQRFAAAVVAVAPRTTARLLSCARATLVSDPAQLPLLDAVFAEVFGGLSDDVRRGDPTAPPTEPGEPDGGAGPGRRVGGASGGGSPRVGGGGRAQERAREVGMAVAASAAERLAERDFDALDPDELALLAAAMRRFRLATPPRRSRRTRRAAHGRHVDLRRTLRVARRTGGDPVRLARRARRVAPRRLVVLCDISGSMQPWARALLQLLYSATGAERAEVFAFATRLTRLTRAMARTSPAVALERAARLAPDWSGGTRIGEALGRFLDLHGGGMARGAVVLIVSDGWETGDPAELGRQMARLRRRAHRIVWANPRTRHAGYRPLVGGMAAAWPHCDAVVSAHRLDAIDELLAALRGDDREG